MLKTAPTTCATARWVAVTALLSTLLLSGCGGGSADSVDDGLPTAPPTTAEPTPTATDVPQRAAALAKTLVEATTASQAVAAAVEVLAFGGIAQADGSAMQRFAVAPAASWTIDRSLTFNLAAEAHARDVSGRITLDELGQMWADFGFPFGGVGSPGEQLLAFLRAWLAEAQANPGDSDGFTPALIAALAARQQPAVDLMDPATRPGDVRLTLLELELLVAAFDRLFEPDASASASPNRERTLAVDPCTDMKQALNTIGGKLAKGGLMVGKKLWGDEVLKALGLTPDLIKAYENYGKLLKALDTTVKVVKMVQIYASAQVTLEVQGSNPVRKPPRGGPRVLVPVKATAGVPEEDWREYQQNNSSETYQAFKACLSFVGMPSPLDLKDIASKIDSWRVSWKLLSGAPRHAFVSSDVNAFNASFAGHPFAMTLQRSSPASAEATLKVDITEEPPLATLFQGPLVTADVRVKAEVFTAEPPSPALLTQVTNLLGTIGALVDLSVGWIQTMFPPATTTVIRVQFHDLPTSLQAEYALSMTFDEPTLRGTPAQVRHTIGGSGRGMLQRRALTAGGADAGLDAYGGTVDFAYANLASTWIGGADDCPREFGYQKRNGSFQLYAGPRLLLNGNQVSYDANAPMQVNFTGDEVPTSLWPAEKQTQTIRCDDTYGQVVTFDWNNIVFVPAANALNLIDQKLMSLSENSATVPGWDMRNGRLLADGTLEMRRTTPTTVTVLGTGGGSTIALDTVIRSVDAVIRLKPTFEATGP